MTGLTRDLDRLREWVGRTEDAEGRIGDGDARRLERLLCESRTLTDGDALPPLWHWLYLPPDVSGDSGADGHPAKGGLIPPIDLPQRLWASGTVWLHDPIHLGAEAARRSTVTAVDLKDGRHGPLCFVTLRHELTTDDGRRLSEDQILVYREIGEPAQPAEPPTATPPWYRLVAADASTLSEYSALTHNRHRVHLDRTYATTVERYPGLVVHGPLLATWLAELARSELAEPVTSFSFRAVAPAFDGETIRLAGRPTNDGAELWAASARGVHMRATARVGSRPPTPV